MSRARFYFCARVLDPWGWLASNNRPWSNSAVEVEFPFHQASLPLRALAPGPLRFDERTPTAGEPANPRADHQDVGGLLQHIGLN